MSAPVTARPLRRDAAENRERLLTAAAQVFAEHGLEAGVEEVARVAGVGMGTLYRRFPSKQALIDELVGGMRRELKTAADDALARTDGTGLEMLLTSAGELLASQTGCLRRLWAHSDDGLEAIEQFRATIVVLLERAQAQDRMRLEITPADISMALWSLTGVVEAVGSVAPKAWRRHLQILLAGLRPSDSRFEPAVREAPVSPAHLRKINASR
jgi:AcrR family transcriptional regulator